MQKYGTQKQEYKKMNPSYTGNKIKELRIARGMTQAELAEKIHVSNKAVSRWEMGKNFPDISILENIAEALDTSVEYILGVDTVKQERERKDSRKEGAKIFFFGVLLQVIAFAVSHRFFESVPSGVATFFVLIFSLVTILAGRGIGITIREKCPEKTRWLEILKTKMHGLCTLFFVGLLLLLFGLEALSEDAMTVESVFGSINDIGFQIILLLWGMVG